MIAAGLLVTLAVAALCASLALLMARLELWLVAHVLAIAATLLGAGAFAAASVSTFQRARRLPARMERR